MPKVSVIVPCYNVAPFLEWGLGSLVNQTLRDIEIICIDDKSTDNTLQILRNWARRDTRIRVLENKKNIGVGFTRNRGIDAATGEYIGFMDPDDWVDRNFYKTLVKYADKKHAEVACGQLWMVDVNGHKSRNPYRSNRDINRTHHNFKFHYTAIYRRDFLNYFGIRYPNLSIGEDTVFEVMVKCALSTPLVLVRSTAYHYCRRLDSLNAELWTAQKVHDSMQSVEMIINIYNERVANKRDYICGAWEYFDYLYNVTMRRTLQMREAVAMHLCDLFQIIRYKDVLYKKNHPLYRALLNNDARGVIEVLNAQQWRMRTYRLFGVFQVMTVSYNMIERVVRICGMILYRSKLT